MDHRLALVLTWTGRVLGLGGALALLFRSLRRSRSSPTLSGLGAEAWVPRGLHPKLKALRSRVRDLGARIDAPPDALVSFDNRDGAIPFVYAESGEYHWRIVERGETLEHRRTSDRDELLYWAFVHTTAHMSYAWVVRDPVEGEQQRVSAWRKQLELLHLLDPRWAQRWRTEFAASLAGSDGAALFAALLTGVTAAGSANGAL